MLLNDNIKNLEKPGAICLPTFVVINCSGFFLHALIFSIKHLYAVSYF